jgi:CopG family nickel-responsive transcriptional regulator
MKRITITLDEDLVEQFEIFRRQHGYDNRSEAVRDLIRDRLGTEHLAHAEDSACLATLTYVYNHHQRELACRTTQLSHHHHDLVISTLHVHLDQENCMETVVLRGSLNSVRAFADALTAQTGVRHGHLYVLPVAIAQVEAGRP